MKLNKLNFHIAAGVMLFLAAGVLPRMLKTPAPTVANANAAHIQIADRYGQLPLAFEINRGQTDSQVRFLARGQGYGLFLTSQEAVLSLRRSEVGSPQTSKFENRNSEIVAGRSALFSEPSLPVPGFSGPRSGERMKNVTNAVLHMRMAGANANAKVTGEQELPGKSNYFIGNDPKKWRTNIPTYAKVRVENVYPGVDLVYYGNQGQLEYDFVVNPGADPSAIKLALTSNPSVHENAKPDDNSLPKIDRDGDLLVQVDGGEVRFHKPVIYQPVFADKTQATTDRIPVDGRYKVNDQSEVAFAIADYDKTKPLVIDPVLVYSTYLGGGGSNHNAFGPTGDAGYAIAVDVSGDAYVTGFTTSTDFPVTPNAFQSTNHDTVGFDSNVFVSKISAGGSALVYSTYLGGRGTNSGGIATGDQGYGIAVDSSGNAYVAGVTASPDFPVTANAFQPTNHIDAFAGGTTAFVTKLDGSGSNLIYSSYLGGSSNTGASGIAADSSGNAYVAGSTVSTDFPVTPNAFQATKRGVYNAFVSKINADGSALVYSTYLGGTGRSFYGDHGTGVAVDSSGNAYVTGYAVSTDFPTTPSAFQGTNHSPYTNAFVTKLNPDGSSLIYSTYLGGSGGTDFNGDSDSGAAIAVDGSGNAYVTGKAYSTDFPTTPNAFQGTNHGGADAFVTKFSVDGSALAYSTYLGGSGNDGGTGIAVDGPGFTYVTGSTSGTDFPTANPIQGTNHGNSDAFVTELTQDGSGLIYSTYLGGSSDDTGTGITVDASGNVYVTGFTYSTNFPTANPLQATNHNQYGFENAFVTKISPLEADLAISDTAPSSVTAGSTITYAIVATNYGPDPASNLSIETVVPQGTTFNNVSVSAGTCTAPGPSGFGNVTCTASNLATGGSITMTLVVNVTAASGSTITDRTSVSSATLDPNSANNETSATTTVN